MADKVPEHFYTKVEAKVLIAGQPYPLVGFIVVYSLDSIPYATFTVALGREASGTGKVSSGHGLLSSVEPFTPVEIKVKLTASPKGRFFHNSGDEIAQRDSGLKDGEDQLIFTGFVSAPVQSKDHAGSSATMTFQAVGHLAALGGSTQMAAGLISTRLESGADVISVQLGPPAAGGATAYHNLAAMIQKTKLTNPRLVDTFILDGIFFELIKMQNTFKYGEPNDSAAAALDRMGSGLGVPTLVLDYGQVPKDLYEKALAKFYGDILNNNWLNGGSDLWGILQTFAKTMLFRIVPAVLHDRMAPVTLGLNGEPWRSFEPSDYWSIHITPPAASREFYSYVGRVGLLRPNTYHGFYQEKMPIGDTIGFAQLDNLGKGSLPEKVAGKMIAVTTPSFLLCPGPASVNSGLGGNSSPDAVNPNTPIADTHHGADMDTFYGGDMGNGYAESVLHDTVFAHRQCDISGRFRLDIAPGSLVRVRTIGERFTGKDEVFFGHAEQVILYGGEVGGGSRMGADFTIRSFRTQQEHDLYTTAMHPLYKERWVGAMLTD